MLEIKNINFAYSNTEVLSNISFRLHANKILGIIGSSGSGKTTLLKIIAGLQQPEAGEICLESERVTGPEENLVPGNEKIKLVAQDFDLKQYVSAMANLKNSQAGRGKESEIKRVLNLKLEATQQTHQTSGGQKQRLAIGKAVNQKPKVLLLDEPFSNLDYPLKEKIKQKLRNTWRSEYMLLAAHDPSDILEMCDELLVLKAGKVVQFGEINKVFNNPKSKYVGELLGKINIIPTKICFQLGLSLATPKKPNQFIRPSKLKISENGLGAIVKNSNFNGKCFEISVELNECKTKLLIYSLQNYEGGSRVNITTHSTN